MAQYSLFVLIVPLNNNKPSKPNFVQQCTWYLLRSKPRSKPVTVTVEKTLIYVYSRRRL